jgi:hypothetical protein
LLLFLADRFFCLARFLLQTPDLRCVLLPQFLDGGITRLAPGVLDARLKIAFGFSGLRDELHRGH